jgi:lipoprotein-releasing system ATP-binding protein
MVESTGVATPDTSTQRRPPVLELSGIVKDFGVDETRVRVLHGLELRVEPGELIAIIGPSGSGKSTLLGIIGLLMPATAGSLRLTGQDVAQMDDTTRTRFRGERIGFVFQFHHLISGLTAAENLMMPLIIRRGRITPDMRETARAALVEVGLGHKMDARPTQMSGGEQQRVAVARALIGHPPLVLADEPTGNLDTENSEKIFDLMRRYNRDRETAIVTVTHDPRIAARCDRIVSVVDGRIEDEARVQREA